MSLLAALVEADRVGREVSRESEGSTWHPPGDEALLRAWRGEYWQLSFARTVEAG